MPRRRLGSKEETKLPANSDKGGRPPDLTPELLEKIIAPLRIGARVTTAAALNAVNNDVLRNWVLKGHEQPDSLYGELIRRAFQAVAQWEIGDISVLHKHAFGAPAEHLMEPARNSNGDVVFDKDGNPVMQPVRDGDGNMIVKTKAIESDWRAAAHRLERRLPKYWYRPEIQSTHDHDAVLTFDAKDRDVKPLEAQTFEEKIASAVQKLEEDY